MTSLDRRDRRPELMDDPSLDEAAHRRALAGLARLNAASGIAWRVSRELDRRFGDEPLRVLDVAAGSGDLAVRLASRSRGRGRVFATCDISETACRATTERARAMGLEVEATTVDVLAAPLPAGYDVVMCHLFLHHLDEQDIVRLLASMRAAAGRGVLVTDLTRTRAGYALAWLASRALTRSPVVHTDALLSVRGALTVDELRGLAGEAGLGEARIRRVWPERMMLWCEA